MREPDKTSNDDLDDTELLGDGETDVEEFLDSMQGEDQKSTEPAAPGRAGWQRIDDWRDQRWLREQLNDWGDWKDDEPV